MRPTLPPDLHRLWRDRRTVQLGTDPARAVILEFSDPATVRILDLLDGVRGEDEVVEQATSALGIAAADTRAVLGTLHAAGLLIDGASLLPAGLPVRKRRRLTAEAAALAARGHPAPALRQRRGVAAGEMPARTPVRGPRRSTPADALRRRAAAKVLVAGAEAMCAPIAVALAGAGVGHVHAVGDGCEHPEDMVTAIERAVPGTNVAPIRAGAATVVVRVGPGTPAITTARTRRAAVLDVTLRDGVVVVGPLVRPAGSPCGRCLELHRRDRDPAWPVLAAQLATERADADLCALTTALAGAAFAADEVLGYLDGRGWRTDGAAVEIRRPGDARRRSWPPHPRCDCRRRRGTCDSG